MTNAITIKNLKKSFKVKEGESYKRLDSLFYDILRFFISNKSSKQKKFEAIKDVSIEIRAGERVGIIGHNGAGKSTLLKIISGVMNPTEGMIKINGRVASLLEIGTGFHPELTAKENIFLNGVLIGMTRDEVANKYNAILEFAGLNAFENTAIKKFSSGMYVRLAFSIAIHLESEILILDEVLAVGDADFQMKCSSSMKEINSKTDRTVILVSHNLSSIVDLCDRVILLDKGKVVADGNPKEIISLYRRRSNTGNIQDFAEIKRVDNCQLISAKLVNKSNELAGPTIIQSEECFVSIQYETYGSIDIYPYVALYNSLDELVWTDRLHSTLYDELSLCKDGHKKCRVKLPFHVLMPNEYNLEIGLGTPSGGQFLGLDTLTFMKNALSVTTISKQEVGKFNSNLGIVKFNSNWSF